MIDFALLSLPIFGVVALGWVAVRSRLATPEILDALGAFSFRFALPPLVFHLISGQPLDRSFNPLFYGGYLASGSLVFALAFVLSRILDRQDTAIAGACATTTTVSNLGFLGPPLVLAFFGGAARARSRWPSSPRSWSFSPWAARSWAPPEAAAE
jgi:malonate transporter